MHKKLYLLSLIAGSIVLFTAFSVIRPESVPLLDDRVYLTNAILQPDNPPQAGEVVKWKPDKAHSSVRFSVKHMVVSESEGYFKTFDGTMEHTKPDFSDAKIYFTVDVRSIDTDSEKRDDHLKGEDFFNAAQYPVISFVSTSFKPGRGKKYKLYGDLTLRGTTKPIVFDVVYGGPVTTGTATKALFTCTATINRFDYGLRWNKATEAGGLVVGQDVTILVKMEMNRVNQGAGTASFKR